MDAQEIHYNTPPNLSHLKKMTTSLGIIQHAKGAEPNLDFGYSIDDSARALLVSIWYAQLYGSDEVSDLAAIYFQHLQDAQLKNGYFHNFKDKNGVFLDVQGSTDSFGRTIWALGAASQSNLVDSDVAKRMLKKALPHIHAITSPRTLAFCLLGLSALDNSDITSLLSDKLIASFHEHTSSDWKWFEPYLTYSNGILPYALLSFIQNQSQGQDQSQGSSAEIGLHSLDFLNIHSRINHIPSPIGNNGWYHKGNARAVFDQQCIDVAHIILANTAAFTYTKNEAYKKEADEWFRWFYGNNITSQVLITPEGGCYDAITEQGVNINQGAESILAYLLAYLALAKRTYLSTP